MIRAVIKLIAAINNVHGSVNLRWPFPSSAKLRSRTFGPLLALLPYQAGSPCHNLIDSGVSFHVPPADSPFFGLRSYLVQNTWRPFHFIPHDQPTELRRQNGSCRL
jgi:hypothetical protein